MGSDLIGINRPTEQGTKRNGSGKPLPSVYRVQQDLAPASRSRLAAEVIPNRQAECRVVADIGTQRDVHRRTQRDLVVEHEANAKAGQAVGLRSFDRSATDAGVLDLRLAVLQTQASRRKNAQPGVRAHLSAQRETEVNAKRSHQPRNESSSRPWASSMRLAAACSFWWCASCP